MGYTAQIGSLCVFISLLVLPGMQEYNAELNCAISVLKEFNAILKGT